MYMTSYNVNVTEEYFTKDIACTDQTAITMQVFSTTYSIMLLNAFCYNNSRACNKIVNFCFVSNLLNRNYHAKYLSLYA